MTFNFSVLQFIRSLRVTKILVKLTLVNGCVPNFWVDEGSAFVYPNHA
jgi:hypothetical protein